MQSVLSDENTPGIIFNTDGVSPFKSSQLTVIIALSNLPANIRMLKDNLITVAIWVGDSKPRFEILFEPLIELFRKLEANGVKIGTAHGPTVIKFQPWYGLFDLVAKAPILNMMQFNGKYGCPTCLHPGTWTSTRYYLPGQSYSLRTNEQVIENAEEAETSNSIVKGIKGKSALTNVVDLVNSIPVDYMHCVLEGVTKWMLEKWFSSTCHRSPFYLGKFLKKVDANLLDQHPPHDFSRAPRSIQKHRKYWKASELCNWLLYYSLPVLMHVLPPLYFHHYSLLVCAIHILLQSELNNL